jgi:hypothetical protein
MLKKLLILALVLLGIEPALAQSVQQSGVVTRNHIPYWVTSGAIGDAGTSADSPISSIGVTNNGGQGFCVNSARISSPGYVALCLGSSTTSPATISLQNFGTASAQNLQFVINGTTYPFPGALAGITINSTAVTGGSSGNCLTIAGATVGQSPCPNINAPTTGSGSIVFNTAPTLAGTIAGNLTWSGTQTYSTNVTFNGPITGVGVNTFTGQGIFQGTSAPASTGGNSVVMGTIAAPTLSNTAQAFLYNTAVNGAILEGDGSTNDVSLFNKSGTLVVGIPTGSTKLNFPSLASGTCSSGLGLDSGNNTITTACPGAAASIQVGTTTITSGTNGKIEFNNSGTLGELTIGNGLTNSPAGTLISTVLTEPQGRLTLTANTPVMTASASAQTTLRYDCYIGGQVPYFNGTNDLIDTITSCEVTDAMVSAASAGQVVSGNVYDVWWVHGGTNRICLAMSTSSGAGGGWASDTGGSNTARGTGYSQLDRVTRPYITNKNSIANCFNGATNYGSVSANQGTYLGTVYASANGQISFTYGAAASGGTAGLLGVWNMYNRVVISTEVVDNGTSYTYSSATVRQARASAGNQIQFVAGLAEDGIAGAYNGSLSFTISGASAKFGIGLDSTTAFRSNPVSFQSPTSSFVVFNSNISAVPPQIGFHTLSANEQSDGTNLSTFDSSTLNNLSAQLRM